MASPVLVVAGIKGGVGRTTTAVNLSAMLALARRKTLLVDLDAKGDATAGVGLERAHGADLQALVDPQRFLEAVRPAPRPEGLDVWPGGPSLETIEGLLWARGPDGRDTVLRNALLVARKTYRAIIVDGPPALGPLGRNALAAADAILLPLHGTANAISAVEETVAAASRVRPPEIPPPVVYGVRIGVRPEEFILGRAPTLPRSGDGRRLLLETSIAYDARGIAECQARGLPAFDLDPKSRLARSYLELCREVMERLLDAAAPVRELSSSATHRTFLGDHHGP
jgi:chromosome partitioning protein